MNAQELYTKLIDEFFGTFIVQGGFKKSSNLFYKDHADFRLLIQVQKSRWNTLDSVSFTFNLGVFDKYVYSKLNNGELLSRPKPEDCILCKRIGVLLSEGNDKWYKIDSSSDVEILFQEIRRDFEGVFQWFDKIKLQNDLLEQYMNETDVYITAKGLDLYVGLHLLRLEEFKEAKAYFKKAINSFSHIKEAQEKVVKIARENNVGL